LFAGVTLGQSPVERVGKGVLAEVAEDFVVELEGGEVGCGRKMVSFGSALWILFPVRQGMCLPRMNDEDDLRDALMASSEKASMMVAS
jgi:hypothetical protein